MKKINFVAFLIIIMFKGASFTNAQELKTVKGIVSYQFNLSRTDKILIDKRDTIQKQLNIFLQNIELLTDYYEKINIGDTTSANMIIKQNIIFKNISSFSLAYSFSLARLYQLGLLYKPCIQIEGKHQENNLIFCTEKKFEDLIKFGNRKIKLKCKYIGSLIIDKIQIYELVDII